MNKLQVILFFAMSLMISSKQTMRREENLFRKTNARIQNAVNKLFLLMQIKNNFTRLDKNRLLLSMHASLKTIAEKNYQIYTGIKKLCYINAKKKPKDGLFNLDKLINVLIEDKLVPTNIPTNETNLPRAFNGVELQFSSLEIPEKFEDAILFLREYLNMEGIELAGFESPFQKIKNAYQKNRVRVSEKRNLKLWRAQGEAENTTEDSSHRPDTRRVFQGKSVKIKKYPFMASIHVMGEFVCSGAVISKDMIITAATCLLLAYKSPVFVHENPEGVVVRVGSDYTERFGEVCLVKTVFFHPQYNPDSLANNLAILKIVKRLQFKKKNKKIRRIEYGGAQDKPPENLKDIVLLGWGDKDAETTSTYERLANSHLDIYNAQQCQEIYSKKFVTEKNFCAGFVSKGGGACSRDVGGPAIVNSNLVGVVSFGPPVCGTPDAPTVFTSIGYYVQWIDSVVKKVPYNPDEITTMRTPIMVTSSPLPLPVTTPATQIPAYTKHPQSRFVKQSRSSGPNDNHNRGYRKPRAEYPKAVQVLTYLLDEIFTGGADDEIDDFMDDNSDSDDEEFSTLITQNGDDTPIVQPVTDRDGLRSETVKSPFMSILDKFVTFIPAQKPMDDNFERNYDSKIVYSPKSQNQEAEETLEIVTGSDAYVKQTTDSPFSVAVKALQTYLGISKHEEATERSTATTVAEIESMLVTKGVEEEVTVESESESDNYESEEGLSIEIPTGLPYIPTKQNHRVTFQLKDDDDDESLQNNVGRRGSQESRESVAENVLNRNFVKSKAHDKSSDVKSDEFVVLLLKQKSTKVPKGKMIKDTGKGKVKTKRRKHLRELHVTKPLTDYEIKSRRFMNSKSSDVMVEDKEDTRRHLLEDYIITN